MNMSVLYTEVYSAIITGGLDDKLTALSNAIQSRRSTLGQRASAEAIDNLRVSQEVIIKMPPGFTPRYLDGKTAIIRKKNIKNCVVDVLGLPEGSRFRFGLSVPASSLIPKQ